MKLKKILIIMFLIGMLTIAACDEKTVDTNENIDDIVETTATTVTEEKTPEPTIENTLARQAYKKLHNDNMVNEEYSLAIYVLTELDPTVTPGIEQDNLFGYTQVFTFSDGSKIKLAKNKKNIFIPTYTHILK